MKNTSKQISQLKEQLREAMDFNNLYHSREFQTRWLPLLLKDKQQTWLDPNKFPNQEDFQRAYNLAFAKACVATSWLAFFEGMEDKITQIQKLIDNPDKNYAI